MKKILPAIACALIIVASCSKKTSAPTAAKAVNAAPVFANYCARCHGADGSSGRAPDLSKVTRSPAEITDVINKGEGRMPAFADQLSAKEVSALTDFVVHMKK